MGVQTINLINNLILTIMKTQIYKGRDGWQANSMTEIDENGQAWQITTYKRKSGVECYAIKGQLSNGCFSYDMFGAKRLDLAKTDGQCNELRVRATHEAGLIEFQRIMSEQPEVVKPSYVVGVGQIIFTDSCGNWDENKRVIYDIESPGNYKTVTLDGKELRREDHIRPYSEKFGIGVYYNENDLLPIEDVERLVKEATTYEASKAEAENVTREAATVKRLADIQKGSEMLQTIPSGVTHVIVANKHVNESDLQSDYHGHSVEQTVYIGFSKHGRDLFPELRKAASNFEDTKHFSVVPESDGNTPEDEHREKYSMGAGYYLGDYKHSNGWTIKKVSLSLDGAGYGVTLQTLQIAIANNLYFIPTEQESEEVRTAPNIEPLEVEAGTIQIIEYGEKAIAVIGDTKPIKDKLRELGGRFNFRLTCGPGWIFPRTRLSDIENAITQ